MRVCWVTRCVQLFATLWNVACLSGSSVHGIFQARILEWLATFSSRDSSWTKDQTLISWVFCIGRQILNHWETWEDHMYASVQFSSVLSHVRLFVTPWTAARQASLSITNARSLPNSCPSSRWCRSAISSSVVPFSSHLWSSLWCVGSFR